MKALSILVVGPMLLLGLLVSAAAAPEGNGNLLLQACTLGIRFDNSPQAFIQGKPDEYWGAGYCLGLVRGLVTMNDAWQHDTKDASRFFCTPLSNTTGQFIRVVVKYLKEHPERLHEQDMGLATVALRDAFPCPPAAQSPRR